MERRKKISAFFRDACFDCHRARHDAIDAATSTILVELEIFVQEFGVASVVNAFPEYFALIEKIQIVRNKIAKSRGDRDNRESIYSPSSTVFELLVGPSLRKALNWRAFIFGGTDSKRARDAK
jgi:hypothetical protein